jgi:hypothetical protein
MVDKAGGHKWLQQIGKILKKTRRCKVAKRRKTTKENISIVIRINTVIHPRS